MLAKAEGAVASGISAKEADFAYATFASENPNLVDNIANDHPGPSSDRNKLVRENYARQVIKFNKWLDTAAGKSCNVADPVIF